MPLSNNTKPKNKPLSDLAIKNMKPKDKRKSDTGENSGLRIVCGTKGTKTFSYRYTSPFTGKLVQVKIGNYPAISLAEARVELQILKANRKSGRCPASEEKAQKLKIKQKEAESQKIIDFTVKDLVELYLTDYIEDRMINGKRKAGARKPKGQDEVRRTLEGDVVRVLGKVLAFKVNRKAVVDLILEIVGRGANVQAGNVLREFIAAYEFSIGLNRFEDDFANPALLAKASLRQARIRLTSKKGTRYLNDDELKLLLIWIPGSSYTPTQKNILRFTLWTACRTGEVCSAEWESFDIDKGVWHIKTKTETERYVQLPEQAITFLQSLKLTTGLYPFPSQKTGLPLQQKTLTEQAWHLRQSDRMLDIPHWTPHDLRRTVRTGLSRLGCPSEIAEAILGHSRKGIEGTYDLHKYEKECKVWLQKWADHMDSLLANIK